MRKIIGISLSITLALVFGLSDRAAEEQPALPPGEKSQNISTVSSAATESTHPAQAKAAASPQSAAPVIQTALPPTGLVAGMNSEASFKEKLQKKIMPKYSYLRYEQKDGQPLYVYNSSDELVLRVKYDKATKKYYTVTLYQPDSDNYRKFTYDFLTGLGYPINDKYAFLDEIEHRAKKAKERLEKEGKSSNVKLTFYLFDMAKAYK